MAFIRARTIRPARRQHRGMRAGRVIEAMPDFYLEDLAPAAFFFDTLAAVSCAFLFCLATFAAGAAAVVAATAGPARTLRATKEVIRVRFIFGVSVNIARVSSPPRTRRGR